MPLVTQSVQFAFDAATAKADRAFDELMQRANQLEKEIDQLGKTEGTTTSSGQGLVQSLVGMINPVDIATGAFAALGKFVMDANAAYAEAEVVQAQVNAVIKSTGGVAGVTAEEVDALSSRLSQLSGVDDEVIARGQAVMLTFTAIGDEVFPRATEAALNMSMAMGTDLQSSILQVGKALNDPVEGASALRRVGVQLTDQQEEQIKTFMEMNDIASAQAVILDELEKEFGGVAETMGDTVTGSTNRLKVAWGDMLEEVGSGNADEWRGFVEVMTEVVSAQTDSQRAANLAQEAISKGLITVQQYNAMEAQAVFTTKTFADVQEELNVILQNGNSAREQRLAKDDEYIAKTQEVIAAEGAIVTSMTAVQAGIQGTISNAYDKYTSTLTNLQADHATLQADLANLQALGWSPTSEKVQTLTTKLQENEAAQRSANVALDESITKMIFQQAAADLDAEAQLKLAREMGVLDEESYAVAMRIETLKQNMNDGKITADEYAAEVADLRDRVESLKDRNIKITIDNIINTFENVFSNKDEGYAAGGIATGPASGHWELLHGTEAVIPLSGGSIPVQLQGGNAGEGTGGNVIVNLYLQSAISLASRDEAETILLPFIEQGVRAMKAEGKLQ